MLQAINTAIANTQNYRQTNIQNHFVKSDFERVPKQDTFINNNKSVSFKGRVQSLAKVLTAYNTETAIKRGEFFYKPEHMLGILKAAKEAGITKAYRVLGNGVESIAFEVPGGHKQSEVFKISQHPVQDYILDIFKEKPFTPHTTILNDELEKYIVPMRRFRVHDVDGFRWYSYFQDRLYSKTFLNGKEKNLVSEAACKRFATQLKKETGYTIFEGENFPDQYGILRYPNGEEEIRILDFGILQKKTEHESDEYWDMAEAVKDGLKAKALRLKKGLPDMRVLANNP